MKNVTDGITRFQKNRHTALMTDWSKNGVGYMLLQKYCSCSEINPRYCVRRWRVCMLGSRFTNPAESNYAPVEGELLAMTYGLSKTKYYTLGSEKLIVCVDHKPLLGILGNGCLMEKIDNSRISRLKEKTLGLRFKIMHIPGSKFGGPDALSRLPPNMGNTQVLPQADQGRIEHIGVEPEDDWDDDSEETNYMSHVFAALRSAAASSVEDDASMEVNLYVLLANISTTTKAITWESIKTAVEKDDTSRLLSEWIGTGCQGEIQQLPARIKPYWNVRDTLRLHGTVPMVGDRTIIPHSLRPHVLETLHSAHQGTYGMMLRAKETFYWPGFAKDIANTRASCITCRQIAPSQSNLPLIEPIVPQYPFQHVVMDHFVLNNQSYGVFVDRFTNWRGVYMGDSAMDVCKVVTKLSEDYGIPETITSDGGKNYTSASVKQLMEDYGIHHRISSVGNPHANCRAEMGVRSMKRLIRDNVTITGKLDTIKFSRALLQYRNTKDRDTGKSPAEFLLGRTLRDFLPRSKEQLMNSTWHRLADQREAALII